MQIAINKTVRPLVVPKAIPSTANVPQFEAVRLMPGSNEVDEATVKAMRESATVQFWVQKNWLELPTAKKEGGEGLEGFELEAALTFVNECMDVATLERWSDVEKRKDVKAALKKRLRDLERALSHETRAEQD